MEHVLPVRETSSQPANDITHYRHRRRRTSCSGAPTAVWSGVRSPRRSAALRVAGISSLVARCNQGHPPDGCGASGCRGGDARHRQAGRAQPGPVAGRRPPALTGSAAAGPRTGRRPAAARLGHPRRSGAGPAGRYGMDVPACAPGRAGRAVVFGLASWRFFAGDSRPSSARRRWSRRLTCWGQGLLNGAGRRPAWPRAAPRTGELAPAKRDRPPLGRATRRGAGSGRHQQGCSQQVLGWIGPQTRAPASGYYVRDADVPPCRLNGSAPRPPRPPRGVDHPSYRKEGLMPWCWPESRARSGR